MLKEIKNIWLNSDTRLKVGTKLLTVSILLILCLPFILTRRSLFGIDFSNSGQIGDTIGGIIGPFIAIIAAILTFLAFWIQYQANQIQIKNFDEQRKDIQIERFQNKFYELLKLHRENVSDILNGSDKDVNYFKESFDDLKNVHSTVEKNYIENEKANRGKNDNNSLELREKIISIAYSIFWLGIDLESRKVIHDLFKKHFDPMFISKVFESFDDLLFRYGDYKIKNTATPIIHYTDMSNNPRTIMLDRIFFREHSSKMGHYFRHIFQTIKFIDGYSVNVLSQKDKYDYAKNLRAQLSNYEQLLLYYNSLSPFGKPWLEIPKNQNDSSLCCFLHKYKMIKNIPLPLATIGVRPEEVFKKEIALLKKDGDYLFEWHEIVSRQ
ncbi:MAG: putative phage abortive infection protein [Ignavibacteriaceae bacterium]|nr:putative phage abortive infection protein [Ignavibacteriaceae bacterium]